MSDYLNRHVVLVEHAATAKNLNLVKFAETYLTDQGNNSPVVELRDHFE